MSTPSPTPPPTPAAQVRVLQVIAGTLIAGVAAFLLVALGIRALSGPLIDQTHPWTDPLILSGLLFGFAALVASAIVPNLIVTTAVRRIRPTDPPESRQAALLGAYSTRTITALALIEGGAFFNLIVFFTSGAWPNLALAVLLLLALIPGIPSRDRLAIWMDRQADEIRPTD